MLADSGNAAGSDSSYHPNTKVLVFSPRLSGEASCPLVFEARRNEIEASEPRSADFVVLPDIDFPFVMPPLSAAKLLLVAFGLDPSLHFVALSSCQLSGDHSRSAAERPWEVP